MYAYSITFLKKGEHVPLDEAATRLMALFQAEKLTGSISGNVFGYIELQDPAQIEALKNKYPDLTVVSNSAIITP